MGGAFEGLAITGPLTEPQREALTAHLVPIAENVRGTDIPRLVDLVSDALTPSAIEEARVLADFGISDRDEYEALAATMAERMAKLVDAARQLSELCLDERDPRYGHLREKYPWLDNIGQFDGVANGRFQSTVDDPATVFRGVVASLAPVSQVAAPTVGGKRGRPNDYDAVAPVVWAVAVYCEENSALVFQRSWGNVPALDANAGMQGGSMHAADLSPQTRTAELVGQVLTGLGVEFAWSRVRTRLLEFAAYLKGRAPRWDDVALLRRV